MSCENARCPDPRLLQEVGDLIFHERFRIAIDLEVLNPLIYDKLIIHELPLGHVLLRKFYFYFVT